MNMERCADCGHLVDTDERLHGEYVNLRYICERCLEQRDAEEWLNQMRQLGREGTR